MAALVSCAGGGPPAGPGPAYDGRQTDVAYPAGETRRAEAPRAAQDTPRQEELASTTLRPGTLGGFTTAVELPEALNLGHAGIQLEAARGRR